GLPTPAAAPVDPGESDAPPDAAASDATAESVNANGGEGIPLGTIAIGALVLVGIVIGLAAVVTLANRKRAPAESDPGDVAAPAAPAAAPRPARPAPAAPP